MADLRPQYTEEAVAANHPTKADVINRAWNVEHEEDGTHKAITADSLVVDGDVGFGTPSPQGPFIVDRAAGTFGIVQISVGDDVSYALEGILPSIHAIIDVMDAFASAVGSVYIRGGVNTVNIISDPLGIISTADVDAKICFLADGDGTYTLKNRLGSNRQFALRFFGW